MRNICKFLLMSTLVVAFTACGRHIAQQKPVNKSGIYLCPMHKEYISTEPGKCPTCSIALVSYDDYRNSESAKPIQVFMPDSPSGMGGSSSGHGGHH